jgi:hypothetical protein
MKTNISRLDGNASLNLDDLMNVVVSESLLKLENEKLKKENEKLKKELLEENSTSGFTPYMMREKELLSAGITQEEIDDFLTERKIGFENESNS